MLIKVVFRYCLMSIVTLALVSSVVGTPIPIQAKTNTYFVYLPLILRQERTTINFDNLTAPCHFVDTTALREAYSSLGVHFSGENANDGGGVVNECGVFIVTGHSSPNFLAFNSDRFANFSDGGKPITPQTIRFDNPINYIEAKFGSGWSVGFPITISAYNNEDILIGTNSVVLTSILQPLGVSAEGISYVVINSLAKVFVLDDLTYIR